MDDNVNWIAAALAVGSLWRSLMDFLIVRQ